MKVKIDILKVGLDPILQFESIARLQSLKLAGAELGLSQPAISHSLHKLESSLGVQLCLRSRSIFTLTEPGTRLFKLAQEIKASLKSYEEFLANNDDFDGLFSIGILDNVQNKDFERNLERTVSQFPKMKLSLQVYTASEILRLVLVGDIDIGFGIFKERPSRLSFQKVGQEEICHYISENHPLWTKKRIDQTDLINLSKTWGDIVSRDKKALASEIFVKDKNGSLKISSYTNNLHAATLVLRSGMSIVPVPYGYLESRKLDFKYRQLSDRFKPYVLKQELISRKDLTNSCKPAQFFLDLFRTD